MHGTAGWVAFDKDSRGERDAIQVMARSLAPPGASAGDVWVDRLAVLGCGDVAGLVAERTSLGAVVVTLSGYVDSHADVQAELEQRGHRVTGCSAAEVVLRGYLEWGPGIARRLTGTYTFAVWDGRYDELILVRDPTGTAGLWWYRTEDGLVFGSNPSAVQAHPHVRGATGLPRVLAPGTVLIVGRTSVRGHSYDLTSATSDRDAAVPALQHT